MSPSLRTLIAVVFLNLIVGCFAAQEVVVSAVTGDPLTGQQVIFTPPTSWEYISLPKAIVAGSLFETTLPDGEFPSLTLLFDGMWNILLDVVQIVSRIIQGPLSPSSAYWSRMAASLRWASSWTDSLLDLMCSHRAARQRSSSTTRRSTRTSTWILPPACQGACTISLSSHSRACSSITPPTRCTYIPRFSPIPSRPL